MDHSAEHKSYKMKWDGECDAEEYKIQCEDKDRESFALRNAYGLCQRQEEEQRKAEELCAKHESYELKWADDHDVEEYMKQCHKEHKDSFAFHNAEGLRQRQEEEERNAEILNAEHDSYELKWAGERDAEEYKEQCDKEDCRACELFVEVGW